MSLLKGVFGDDEKDFQPSTVYSSVCNECGLVIGDKIIHSKWHGKIDATMILTRKM